MAVFDIQTIDVSLIDSSEVFVLDANVLFWLYSGYVLPPRQSAKATVYSNFVGELISNGNSIYTISGNVQEVLNLIERTEYNLRKSSGAFQNKKDFRNNAIERAAVKTKTSAVYSAIKSGCSIYDMEITEPLLDDFIRNLETHAYDPMDYLVVETSIAKGYINIVTDDSDYRIDSRINVYTMM